MQRRSEAGVTVIANGHEAETMPSAPARETPDVRRHGSRYIIRREGDPLDDEPEVDRLHNELADAHRRIAGLEEGKKR